MRAILDHPSPNYDERARPIDLVVLHYTGMQDLETALARLTDPEPRAGRYPGPWQDPAIDPATPLGRVSAHYVVAADGRIFRLVAEERRAWHAGASFWGGLENVNHNAIGIEIENGGHDFGLPAYPDAQIAAVIELVRDILGRHSLPVSAVVGHSDVAPGRKVDPGEHFPWAALEAAGAALMRPAPAGDPNRRLAGLGDSGAHVAALQEALAGVGYGLDVTGAYDEAVAACLASFQRRFRPARCDGVLDEETLVMINGVLDQVLRLALPRRLS